MKTITEAKKFLHRLVPAGILSVTTLLSYITGLLRDRTFAQAFGAGRELDIYNASFLIPDLLLNIFIASALSPVFIPLLSGLRAQNKKEEMQTFASTITFAASLLIIVLASLTMLLMPLLAPLVAPGFSPDELRQLITMSRIILISPMIMAISNTLGCILVSFREFLWYGISPVVYNIGLISGAFLVPTFGLKGLAIGVIIGALLHLTMRIIGITRSTFQFTSRINLKMKECKELLKLMIPKMLGHPVEQLKFFGFTRIATGLAAGSVTAISFSRNFQSVPVSLFGIAIAVAAFPRLAEAASLGNRTEFIGEVKHAAINIIAITIPCTLFLLLVGDLPVKILLGGGKFVGEGVTRTATALGFFALAIPTESLIHLLARCFYALKNTITPVVMSITGLTISVGVATWMAPQIGIIAIPLGFFGGTAVEATCLSVLLFYRLKNLHPKTPLSEGSTLVAELPETP